MAITQVTYTGNGSTTLYSFSFPYIDTTDVKVKVNSVIQTTPTHYTFANATTIQFVTAPAAGAEIRIYRETDIEENKAVFYPGSSIRAQDLNDNFDQSLYVIQEIRNANIDPFNPEFFDDLDMNGHRIIELGNPVDPTDATNKSWVDANKLALTGGTLTGDLLLSNRSDLRFGESSGNGTNWVAFQAPAAIAANVTWTLPSTDGAANQVMKTNGSGTLSWTSVDNIIDTVPGDTNSNLIYIDKPRDTVIFGAGTEFATGYRIIAEGTFNGFPGGIGIARSNNAPGATAGIGSLNFLTSLHESVADITVKRDGGTWTPSNAPALGSYPTSMHLSTTPNNDAFSQERITIRADGKVGINQTAPSQQLHVGGNVKVNGTIKFEGSVFDAFETTLDVVNPTADRTITLPNKSGTVALTSDVVGVGEVNSVTSAMIVDGTIVNDDISATANISHGKLASIPAARVLMGNASNYPTATSITGHIVLSSDGSTQINAGVVTNGSIANNAAIAHSKLANIPAGQVLLGNASNVPTATALTGDVTVDSSGVTAIGSGVIVDGDINASAAIADTKLATISTAGKVSNSATTATSANTASAIVARDASGNFSAGTITANLSGNASTVTTNANLTGDVTSVGNATSIAAGVIVDADINASAAIADTKLATISTANKVNGTALTGTIPSAVLGNSTAYVGTTAVALNRASANQDLTGISSVALPGSTSGTVTVQPAAVAGTTTITLPATTGTVITTGDSGTVTSTMIADGTIVNADINASAAIDKTKISGTAITAADSGTVTSTMIADGTIVNADVNASAAIAGTKISPDFGSQNTTTTGTSTAASFIPSSSTAPTNGVYLPAANSVGISTGGSGRLFVDSSGRVGIGASSPANGRLNVSSTTNQIALDTTDTATYGRLDIGHFTNGTFIGTYAGSNTASDLIRFGTGGTERLRITSAGLVGVGTSSPSSTLTVGGNPPAAGAIGAVGASGGIALALSDNVNCSMYVRTASGGAVIGTDAGGVLRFATNGNTGTDEKVRIDSSGRLLKGTTTSIDTRTYLNTNYGGPSIQTHGTDQGGSAHALYSWATNANAPASISLNKSVSGTVGTRGALSAANSDLGAIVFAGDDGTNFIPGASILAEVDGTPGVDDMPGRIVLSTTADGASSPTERMRISQNGDIVFRNMPTVYPYTDNAVQLGGGGTRFTALYAVNGTIQTSDQREKTEITDSLLGSDFIKSLRPVSYKWIDGGNQDTGERDEQGNYIYKPVPGVRTHWGFIAQEVKQSIDAAGVDFGGWVLTDKDDPQSQQALRYDQFIAPLTKALQEALAEIDVLKAKVAALETA